MRAPIPTALLVLALVGGAGRAHAHNKAVHRAMPELAYELMKAVTWDYNARHGLPNEPTYDPPGQIYQPDFSATAPQGVSAADWDAFLHDIAVALPRLHALPAGLPDPHTRTCDASHVLPLGYPESTLGALALPPSLDYVTGSGCGIDYGWTPGGVFTGYEHPGGIARTDSTGMALGFWAASIDDEADDTHIWVRPTSAGGLGEGKALLDEAVRNSFTAAFVPLVCAWDFLFNHHNCLSDATSLADASNPVDKVEGLLPGVGDWSGDPYNTMWHFINVQPGLSNTYDDHQGLFYEEAGLGRVPDAVDVGIMVWFGSTGLSVNWEKSNGPHRYEVSADDGHPNTVVRTKSEWQFLPVSHTPIEPVDNLAYYGWSHFLSEGQNAHFLGWPLHAIGDASEPHHIIGSTGWGHRPFEDAVDHHFAELRYIVDPVGNPVGDVPSQQSQLIQILWRAYHYRQFVLAWRAGHPTHAKDVPVRDLVTSVAEETYNEVMAAGAWPYDPAASSTYLVDNEAGISLYSGQLDSIRPLVERGIGASLAFLVSATEAY